LEVERCTPGFCGHRLAILHTMPLEEIGDVLVLREEKAMVGSISVN
jgi:hypothetical protein